MSKIVNGHILIEPKDGHEHKDPDEDCRVCDHGLLICKVCGAAEIELDQPCPIVREWDGDIPEEILQDNPDDYPCL